MDTFMFILSAVIMFGLTAFILWMKYKENKKNKDQFEVAMFIANWKKTKEEEKAQEDFKINIW